MPIWNERFCQMMLFARIGSENVRQPVVGDCPVGHVRVMPVKELLTRAEFGVLATPATCGHDAVFAPVGPPVWTQFPAGALACGVPTLWVSTPDDAAEKRALAVLTKCGGRAVHVHHVERQWGIKDTPLHAVQPDPLLERDP